MAVFVEIYNGWGKDHSFHAINLGLRMKFVIWIHWLSIFFFILRSATGELWAVVEECQDALEGGLLASGASRRT